MLEDKFLADHPRYLGHDHFSQYFNLAKQTTWDVKGLLINQTNETNS